tara:strand:- start:817 stop:1506 length:690 start_codon:yes stop_codon:yes gene_type:complete
MTYKLMDILNEVLGESNGNDTWYHGSEDSRTIEKLGGFESRTMAVTYIEDFEKHEIILNKLRHARANNATRDMKTELSNELRKLSKKYTYNTPIFLTNKHSVARTYADPARALDYQNATQKIFTVDVNCNKIVTIKAKGKRFRFIDIDLVKRGFIHAGVNTDTLDNVIKMFTYNTGGTKSGIKTDVVAAIAHYLKFDCVDVVGVLDSYDGGKLQSTVKMVLNPKDVTIK